MRVLISLAVALTTAGSGLLAHGCYLPAKAALAQLLLRRAWTATDGGEDPMRPWPWAETWPVARLLVPRLEVDQIVLAGSEGAALAFAPGHVDGTSRPGEGGNVVVAGHRDTVFSFVGELTMGDALVLESPGGRRRTYRVDRTAVVHELETEVLLPSRRPTLTLITCYPLDARRPGGHLRFVVRATACHHDGETTACRQMKFLIPGQLSSNGRNRPPHTGAASSANTTCCR